MVPRNSHRPVCRLVSWPPPFAYVQSKASTSVSANSLGHHLSKCRLVSRPVPRAPHSSMWRQASPPPILLPPEAACLLVARPTHHPVCRQVCPLFTIVSCKRCLLHRPMCRQFSWAPFLLAWRPARPSSTSASTSTYLHHSSICRQNSSSYLW